jgi:hypothetical protein
MEAPSPSSKLWCPALQKRGFVVILILLGIGGECV